jgi:hypothetical protein
MSSKKLINTGKLRNFLSDAMVKMEAGEMTAEDVGALAKLAGQINESLYAEIRFQRLQLELKREVGKFGELIIGDDEGNEKVRNPPEEK